MTDILRKPALFNVNYEVKVKLTNVGRVHLRDKEREYGVRYQVDEDAEGWSTWQLWELVSIFGPKMYNGCPVPFETEIILLPDEYAVRVTPEVK